MLFPNDDFTDLLFWIEMKTEVVDKVFGVVKGRTAAQLVKTNDDGTIVTREWTMRREK